MAPMTAPVGGGGNAKPRELPPAGTHPARFVQLVDLGTQQKTYNGEESEKHEVWFKWELPKLRTTIQDDDGNDRDVPQVATSFYTYSMNGKANLRRMVEGVVGGMSDADAGQFYLEALLGRPCAITITHYDKRDGSKGDKVSVVTALMEGYEMPPQEMETVFFSMGDDYSPEAFEKLDPGIQEMVKRSPEWKRLNGEEAPPAEDVPF